MLRDESEKHTTQTLLFAVQIPSRHQTDQAALTVLDLDPVIVDLSSEDDDVPLLYRDFVWTPLGEIG